MDLSDEETGGWIVIDSTQTTSSARMIPTLTWADNRYEREVACVECYASVVAITAIGPTKRHIGHNHRIKYRYERKFD